ncbi:MAG: regulatory signaling modulator protein AmpE [Woeseia sp.]
MKLIALLIGLVVERLATQLFHLRELRWLDRVIDLGFRQVDRFANWPALIPVIVLAVILVLPIFLVVFGLGDALFGFPYLILAIVVLFFSLGPKDISEDVDEYCRALEGEDENAIHRTARALAERELPSDPMECIQKVEEAVCVQANNRFFAVIFWFVVLGPFGAWSYRVTDLIRRRAVFNAARDEAGEPGTADMVLEAAGQLHGWLAWVPARLTAIGYAMAGSFEGALSAWRTPEGSTATTQREHSEELLARVGVGALALQPRQDESVSERGVRGATAANGLVFRLLFIWAAVIAAMTLYGWSV